jgi:hypothetical protein
MVASAILIRVSLRANVAAYSPRCGLANSTVQPGRGCGLWTGRKVRRNICGSGGWGGYAGHPDIDPAGEAKRNTFRLGRRAKSASVLSLGGGTFCSGGGVAGRALCLPWIGSAGGFDGLYHCSIGVAVGTLELIRGMFCLGGIPSSQNLLEKQSCQAKFKPLANTSSITCRI